MNLGPFVKYLKCVGTDHHAGKQNGLRAMEHSASETTRQFLINSVRYMFVK